MTDKDQGTSTAIQGYSAVACTFHWLTVAFVLVQVPIGITMVYRGYTLNIWDDATNQLYSTHKLVGFTLLWLVLARISYRLWHGAPPPEPTLEPWQRRGSTIVHDTLYVLLVVVPILGWIGISLYPALDIFGLFSLPALASPDQDMANVVLEIHKSLAWLLIVLVIGHVGMALFHYFVRKDHVLQRMLSGLPRR